MPTIVGGFQRPAYRLGPPREFAPLALSHREGGADGRGERAPRRTRQVFVAYPYGMFDRADYRGVFTALGRLHDVKFIFADERITNLQVVEKIRLNIRLSDFALFDVSGWNANVAFELGMAYEMSGVDWYICFNPDKNGRAEVPSNIRGLDRIEWRGFAELREKIALLMEQWYPPAVGETLDNFVEDLKTRLAALARERGGGGMDIGEIAAALNVRKDTAQFAVRRLVAEKKLASRGKGRAVRYFLKK